MLEYVGLECVLIDLRCGLGEQAQLGRLTQGVVQLLDARVGHVARVQERVGVAPEQQCSHEALAVRRGTGGLGPNVPNEQLTLAAQASQQEGALEQDGRQRELGLVQRNELCGGVQRLFEGHELEHAQCHRVRQRVLVGKEALRSFEFRLQLKRREYDGDALQHLVRLDGSSVGGRDARAECTEGAVGTEWFELRANAGGRGAHDADRHLVGHQASAVGVAGVHQSGADRVQQLVPALLQCSEGRRHKGREGRVLHGGGGRGRGGERRVAREPTREATPRDGVLLQHGGEQHGRVVGARVEACEERHQYAVQQGLEHRQTVVGVLERRQTLVARECHDGLRGGARTQAECTA